MVHADEIASLVPQPAERPAAGHDPGQGLRGPRLLDARFRARLDAKARELGFDACRVAAPDSIPQARERLAQWLESGAHGDMEWMEETAERRADPRALWPDVRSIIMLAMNYGPQEQPFDARTNAPAGAGEISVYARHRDYHDVIKGKLKTLAQWIVKEARAAQGAGVDADAAQVKVFVDTAPVMEKPLAQAAGLGWQGKHTNLVSREMGSWFFLASIFTTLDIERDSAEADHCGSCRACLDACPTDAFPAPYRIDARRCISYLTIEHKGQIAREFRAAMGNRIYGCDDCLAACPWNKFASEAREMKLAARADLVAPDLAMLAALDETAFRNFFSASPVKRIGHARFLRNVLVAIGNTGDAKLLPHTLAHIDHESPLVRGMAAWACARLMSRDAFNELAQTRMIVEKDTQALQEWTCELEAGERA
ncbi:MAG: tRNA epoxyqueuosine(34) reductase QueG [Beijerinckiaceae bacterium]|nr:tRNA epoxyqueuosine(34) reductase QueG [Beijerinckiaceae bacterium]